ncbi:MAG: BPTD_3080 family restriction endonuclease [Myxococcales bacterium]
MSYEVPTPIINSPFEPPGEHWRIREGEVPERAQGRRPASYFYRDPRAHSDEARAAGVGTQIELKRVTDLRARVDAWRTARYPGVTRTTLELLDYWQRDGRQQRLFFAQVEAIETILFLNEARADLRQGVTIPRDDPGNGAKAFVRYACKMATGAGKTTVMGMAAAWSILNKVNDRGDARFSDAVLIVCPNVTIRDRLRELDPALGEASLYRTRDLVPPHLMPLLTRGRVLVTNWHVFERQNIQVGGVAAKVTKAGEAVLTRETVVIGASTTTARGKRYMTPEAFEALRAAGNLEVVEEHKDESGALVKAVIEAVQYKESRNALVERVLGRDLGRKGNLLVINDEAHHAYRIRRESSDADEDEGLFGEDEEAEAYEREATVWVEGLDHVHARRGINFCVDLSATPYFLKSAGAETGRPFPWVVSDFGLVDAIESGLVKIPQLAVRDTTGADIPGAFNIWQWVVQQLRTGERGGQRSGPKPEAILKYAHHAIAMLAGDWRVYFDEWRKSDPGGRPPVFILVCKNTKIANVLYDWLAEDKPPFGIPPAKLDLFKNAAGAQNTILVHSKVVEETDTGEAKSDESRWMRFTLDTVGKSDWPRDALGSQLCPAGFEELADKLGRPKHPPGRDVRCIVSVGMLTEGWDCNTVTHIVGLRPFMSQLLCEQVVGRGLRRASYDVGDDGLFKEEVARIFGVPFEIVPFKANPQAGPVERPIRRHVHAVSSRAEFLIEFPRVEGYTQAVCNRVTIDWASVPPLALDPGRYASGVEVKDYLPTDGGKVSLSGPGRIDELTLAEFRKAVRLQEIEFAIASQLLARRRSEGSAPAHVLFPQLLRIVRRYVEERVHAPSSTDKRDVYLSPYYGQVLERLDPAIRAEEDGHPVPEIPLYETSRGPGSTADVDFWTARDVREVVRSHVNVVVADTAKWEQSAAYAIDKHPLTAAFVKNAGLGFAIPYLHDGAAADYVPDFVVRLKGPKRRHVILEVKGFDPLMDLKRQAAERWVSAVNAHGAHGTWAYALVTKVNDTAAALIEAEEKLR